MGEYDAEGNLVSHYSHGLGLIARDNDFYTFNGNGNTSEMINMANEIVNFYLYEPFGKTIYEVENTDNSYQFVGQLGVQTVNDDLVYMRNRFYSPALGRFMSEDPIGLAGGDVSFYRYVQNDPVNWVDPDGLVPIGAIKKALKRIHKKLGGSLPKGRPGKFGSPQRGDSKKGYRLDPGHPNRPEGDPEAGPHINYWDYSKGKANNGGVKGAEPILGGLAADLLEDFIDPFSSIAGELGSDDMLCSDGSPPPCNCD